MPAARVCPHSVVTGPLFGTRGVRCIRPPVLRRTDSRRIPGTFTGPTMLEQRLDRLADDWVFWHDFWPEAPDYLPVRADQELLEVPAHVARLARVIGKRAEYCVERVLGRVLHIQP